MNKKAIICGKECINVQPATCFLKLYLVCGKDMLLLTLSSILSWLHELMNPVENYLSVWHKYDAKMHL
jgi:hypothetical protein